MLLVGRGWLLDNPEPLLLPLRPTSLLYNSCVTPRVACCDGNRTIRFSETVLIHKRSSASDVSRIRQVWMTASVLSESWMRWCLSFNYPNCQNVPQTQSKERMQKHLQQKQDGSRPLTLPENRSVSSPPKGPLSWSALLSEQHINILWFWQAVKRSTNPSLTHSSKYHKSRKIVPLCPKRLAWDLEVLIGSFTSISPSNTRFWEWRHVGVILPPTIILLKDTNWDWQIFWC